MVSEEFKKNIESGNIIFIRCALSDYLFVDKSFRKFDEALSEAKKKIEILEKYDGLEMDLDGPWTLDYLSAQKVALMNNFSVERISHLKKVIISVLGENNPSQKKQQSRTREAEIPDMQRKEVRREVISETEVKRGEISKSHTSQTCNTTTNARSNNSSGKRTGSKTISETITNVKSSDEKKTNTGLIVGGGAVAIGGAIAVAGGGGFMAYAALAAGAGTAGVGIYKTFKD